MGIHGDPMGTHGGGRGNGDLWGPRGDPVRTPQGPMGTPCGPMETPWEPLGGAMGTHGDTTRTHGGGMGAQSYDTLVFAIVCCRIGRTKLLRSVGSNSQTNKHLLLQTTFRAQRALPEVGAKGTAPSVTQRCWQSLADAAWNYPVERESHR